MKIKLDKAVNYNLWSKRAEMLVEENVKQKIVKKMSQIEIVNYN